MTRDTPGPESWNAVLYAALRSILTVLVFYLPWTILQVIIARRVATVVSPVAAAGFLIVVGAPVGWILSRYRPTRRSLVETTKYALEESPPYFGDDAGAASLWLARRAFEAARSGSWRRYRPTPLVVAILSIPFWWLAWPLLIGAIASVVPAISESKTLSSIAGGVLLLGALIGPVVTARVIAGSRPRRAQTAEERVVGQLWLWAFLVVAVEAAVWIGLGAP